MDNSTIVAPATAPGKGGIGIVKISGPKAIAIAGKIFLPVKKRFPSDTEADSIPPQILTGYAQSHCLYYGSIVDPQSRQIIDEVLLAVMRAPRTYTCEDVVEINAHGGPVAVQAILNLVVRQGAQIAQPGEFTKRAFLNGRIDLTQAEAIIDLINARTDKSLKAAAAQVEGRLKSEVETIRNFMVDLMAHNEAAIDFPEEVEDTVAAEVWVPRLHQHVLNPLKQLLRQHTDGKIIKEGIRIAIVGRPNVGKSSLFNRLVQKDRAIVTAIPGTTRDVIEELLNIQGVPVLITDTAGLHESMDPVETIGMEKTLEHLNGCDLVLLMLEADHPLTSADQKVYEYIHLKPKIVVYNKIDLLNGNKKSALPTNWSIRDQVEISARYDQGIDVLKDKILLAVSGKNPIDIGEEIIPNLRHKNLLEVSLAAAEDIVRGLASGITPELSAITIQEAIDALGEILGQNVKIDVLDRIFSEFCIGK